MTAELPGLAVSTFPGGGGPFLLLFALMLWWKSFLFCNRFRIFTEFIVDNWTKDRASVLGNCTGFA